MAAPVAGHNDPIATDPMQRVDPELRAALEGLRRSDGPAHDLDAASLAEARSNSSRWDQPLLPEPPVNERLIPGPKGAPDVRVFIAGARGAEPKPAVLHMHGGGYVLGSAVLSRRSLQELATTCNCIAVSVDYRLAPETRFPGSLEDNYAALTWVHRHAAELGIDSGRVAIKGESAGGGHAAMLAIAARDRGEFPIHYQMLIYPMLDDRTGATHAVPAPIGSYVWTRGDNRFGWSSLLGRAPGSPSVPAGSVPARVASLAGLPPAYIAVGSIDLFVDEDIEYARRLVAAGVPTELHVVPGAYHAFEMLAADAAVSRKFIADWQGALRKALGG